MLDFEFNPKGHSLLDDQLAESGLEMNIIGAILGYSGAEKANSQAEANYQESKKAAKRLADKTNEYNKRVFEADKKNYYNNRDYEWETAIKSWQYKQDIEDFDFLQQARQYVGSVENTQQQLTYNTIAGMQARESEQASLNEIMNQTAFQSESNLIDSLQEQGKVAVMQAGKSRAKAIQTTLGELGRNTAIMSASLMSAGRQSMRNLQDIALSQKADNMSALASMMISPERRPDIPKPIQAPERIFVEPMEVDPAFIAAPIKQDPLAAAWSGLMSDASTVANVATAFKP